MDPFQILMALAAIAFFVLIARNLWRLDTRERPTPHATEPDREIVDILPPPPPAPPPPVIFPDDTRRDIPPSALDELHETIPPPAPPIRPPTKAPDLPVEATPSTSPVQFSTYYPKEVAPNAWSPLIAYLFRETAADAVLADATQQLGDRMRDFREVGDEARQPIAEGAKVTATPRLDGFQFNPPSVSVGFFENWHRFDFKMRATTAPLNLAANGQLTFTVEGVIVADIPLSVFVGQASGQAATVSATRKPYDAIFCSYSRKDLPIVERVERAYKILGNDYLRDMTSIRSGEEWSPALERLIDRADIFQLFWSEASAVSNHVKREWEYALSLKTKPSNFIRPVYWQQPMPAVPDVMSKINFAYEPTLDD